MQAVKHSMNLVRTLFERTKREIIELGDKACLCELSHGGGDTPGVIELQH